MVIIYYFDINLSFPQECERQFASRLALTSGGSNEDDDGKTIVNRITTESGKTMTTTTTTLSGPTFPSLFDGLPLYQGYGMISQHVGFHFCPQIDKL